MKFLRNFQQKMEVNLEDTKKSIDKTNVIMNGRLDGIEKEVRTVSKRMDENDQKSSDLNRRMDQRLTDIENQMKKSTRLNMRNKELKEKEGILDLQPNCSKGGTGQRMESSQVNGSVVKNYGKKVDDITEVILNEPVGIFRSSWARNIEAELKLAAGATGVTERIVSDTTNKAVDGERVDDELTKEAPDDWEERWY